jgi:hypothetical protein
MEVPVQPLEVLVQRNRAPLNLERPLVERRDVRPPVPAPS